MAACKMLSTLDEVARRRLWLVISYEKSHRTGWQVVAYGNRVLRHEKGGLMRPMHDMLKGHPEHETFRDPHACIMCNSLELLKFFEYCGRATIENLSSASLTKYRIEFTRETPWGTVTTSHVAEDVDLRSMCIAMNAKHLCETSLQACRVLEGSFSVEELVGLLHKTSVDVMLKGDGDEKRRAKLSRLATQVIAELEKVKLNPFMLVNMRLVAESIRLGLQAATSEQFASMATGSLEAALVMAKAMQKGNGEVEAIRKSVVGGDSGDEKATEEKASQEGGG